MKRIFLALAMVMTVASLSGCIITPHRHDGYRYDGYSHHDRDRCDSRYHDCGRWR
jgi:hypothetical protein